MDRGLLLPEPALPVGQLKNVTPTMSGKQSMQGRSNDVAFLTDVDQARSEHYCYLAHMHISSKSPANCPLTLFLQIVCLIFRVK